MTFQKADFQFMAGAHKDKQLHSHTHLQTLYTLFLVIFCEKTNNNKNSKPYLMFGTSSELTLPTLRSTTPRNNATMTGLEAFSWMCLFICVQYVCISPHNGWENVWHNAFEVFSAPCSLLWGQECFTVTKKARSCKQWRPQCRCLDVGSFDRTGHWIKMWIMERRLSFTLDWCCRTSSQPKRVPLKSECNFSSWLKNALFPETDKKWIQTRNK